jgi:DNA topoisomerase IB
MPRLRRADCSGPGYTRRKRGRGFAYLDSRSGERVRDPETLDRIRSLVIPPAWTDVWICPQSNGHLQAVGVDDRGRRQYLYHEQWRTRRDAEKFDRMLAFARTLPDLRAVCAAALDGDGLERDRVLACATRLIDLGFFRIGGEAYAEENGSYGITTMLKRHVTIEGEVITFDYVAKSGKERLHSIVDTDARAVVAALKRRRGGGEELLAHKVGRRWVDVTARDVNDFIKAVSGEHFSAKDFRTWNATVLASVALAVSGTVARSESGRKRAISRAVSEVAHYLGNTPAVSRKSYIDPRVFDRYRSGWTISGALDALGEGKGFGEPSTQGPIEQAVLDLLRMNRESDALERVPAA